MSGPPIVNGSFRRLPLEPDQGFPQRFSFPLGGRSYDVSAYVQLMLASVSTSAQTEVPAGRSSEVTPQSMTGIEPGLQLTVDLGAEQEEVQVLGISSTGFTAPFRKAHGPSPYPIRSRFQRSDPPETVYDLAPAEHVAYPIAAPGFVVLRIGRTATPGDVVFQRKLVVDPALVHRASELALVLKQARVARGNLNGAGSYGTDIVIGVAQLWE